MKLNGKTIVITGAARGLGFAMAQALSECGARLALIDHDDTTLTQAVAALARPDSDVLACRSDVSDETSVKACFTAIGKHFGRVDALVNNAGITRDGLLVKVRDGAIASMLSLDDWNAVLDVDLRGVFLCGREAAALMIEQGDGGAIVNISSISRAGNFGQSNYSAAKAGVAALTVTWARELARHGIRVGAVAPGFCNTAMVAKMPEAALARVRDSIPLKRLGEPSEIAHGVRFILENDYFTGRVLELDGGLRL